MCFLRGGAQCCKGGAQNARSYTPACNHIYTTHDLEGCCLCLHNNIIRKISGSLLTFFLLNLWKYVKSRIIAFIVLYFDFWFYFWNILNTTISSMTWLFWINAMKFLLKEILGARNLCGKKYFAVSKIFFCPQYIIGLLRSNLGIFQLWKFVVVWVYIDLLGVVIWQHIHPSMLHLFWKEGWQESSCLRASKAWE